MVPLSFPMHFFHCTGKEKDRLFQFPNKFDRMNPDDELEIRWSRLHISILDHYILYLSNDLSGICLAELLKGTSWNESPGSPSISAHVRVSFAQGLQSVFMVPRLKKFHEGQVECPGSSFNFALCLGFFCLGDSDRVHGSKVEEPGSKQIKKHQLVEAFISFLLQLLYHKTDSIIDLLMDRLENLEKELRFLCTVLGDATFMRYLSDYDEDVLISKFEVVANEAGSLLHLLLFSIDPAFSELEERVAVVMRHMDILKDDIMKFLSFISRKACTIPGKTSVMDSLHVLDSLIDDLKDLMNREEKLNSDVGDQIKKLLESLTRLQSSIELAGRSQPSESVELRETLMRIGDTAHEAQYIVISFVVGHAPPWYLIHRLTSVNLKIELCGGEIQQLLNKQKFGEGEAHVAGEFNSGLSFRANRNSEVDDSPVGSEDKETYLLDKLTGWRADRQFISIFGMPGLGKTTLANKLSNHPLLRYRFDKICWCVVSQTYQMRGILATILINIENKFGKDKILSMEEETLVEHIHKTLKGRRYLIVLDDIWESEVLDGLFRCFPDDGNGSRILFTTRNRDVAPPRSFMYEMPYLTDKQCWELLEKKVFGNQPCHPQLQRVGRQIAANCGGLPLAVVVIAGILSTDTHPRSWEEVRRNLASYILDNGDSSVMQILKLSYKHLPHHLKSCFLYLGAFQKDREIHVAKLVRLWIAEGFVRAENKEIKAVDYLTELIDRSLIMVVKRRSDGGVKTCNIHDLLRDLCMKTCQEENFMEFVESSCLSIYNEGDHLQTLQSSVTWSFCQNMHSLFGLSTMLPLHIRDMRLLKVLHFDCISTYLSGIEYLVCLRYLIIRDLPPSVGNLVNLEYLHVETNGTVYLSSAVINMKKLRYISVGSEARYDEDCNISQTNNLEFLSWIVIDKHKDEQMLKCSPHLRKLKLSTSRHVDLSFLSQLDSLDLRFYDIGLKGISLPSNIRKLALFSSSLTSEEISIIGRLENLEILKLRIISFEDGRWDTREGEFQKVKFLKMKVENLCVWNVDSSEHFPVLERLFLSDCGNLKDIPCEIGETLQLIEVQGICKKSLLESAKRVQQEQVDNGNERLRIITNSSRLSFEDNYFNIGFEGEKLSVLEMLLGQTRSLQIISILGMPGLGKTTLTKKVYSSRIVREHFDILSWCVVPETYTMRSLLAKILTSIQGTLDKDRVIEIEEESMAQQMYQILRGRRYLIVLDDIWDSDVCGHLRMFFPDDDSGSRILITTRNRDAVPPESKILELPNWSNAQCWKLLKKMVFVDNRCPPELLEIGKKIAENCRGLPHAVVIAAGILSSMNKEKSSWEQVGRDLPSHIFNGGNYSMMKRSFQNLPEHLTPCLLYFGVFHENEEIHVRELLRLWIAERFTEEKDDGKSAENVAEEYLTELIDRNLVKVVQRRSDGGVKTCVINDFLRHLCLQICEGQDVQIHMSGNRPRGLAGGSHLLRRIGSLFGRRWVSPSCVRDTRLLRILHCGYIDRRYNGIEFLVCLKYLVIKELPPSIGSFVNLEYLRLETDKEVCLPSTVFKMNKLRCIQVGNVARYDEECETIFQANKLEFLSIICIMTTKDEEMLKLSACLRKLELSTSLPLDLRFLTQLESLNLRFCESGRKTMFSFPLNIQKLTLSCFELGEEHMSMIGRLENLKFLKLKSVSFAKKEWFTRKGEFARLQFLKLDGITHLTDWLVFDYKHLPQLQRLILRNCYHLFDIPSEIGEITTLEMLEIQGQCPGSLVMSAQKIQEEQRHMGNEYLQIIVPNALNEVEFDSIFELEY